MAESSPWTFAIPTPLIVSALFLVSVHIFMMLYDQYTSSRPHPGIPLLSTPPLSPKASWIRNGSDLLSRGVQEYSSRNLPFQVMTGTGPKIILPNRFADEVKDKKELDFAGSVAMDFFPTYPGMEGPKTTLANVKESQFLVEMVRTNLTQSLGLITGDLVEETISAVSENFGEGREWKTMKLKSVILEVVARLSSRVFLGKALCRNKGWLDIAKNYAVDVIGASRELRAQPAMVRWVVHWFLLHCKRCRQHVRDAKRSIQGEFERRAEVARKAIAEGRRPEKKADAVGWMIERAKGKELDLVGCQLQLSMAAIHTTTESLTQLILDLCEHPECFEPLREEIVQVIGQCGWAKTSMYQLKLMDSFMKELQRMHRPLAAMQRIADAPVELSDGTKLPKGCRIMIKARHFDPRIYADPYKFDIHRFVEKSKESGQASTWQYVTTSSDFIAFGHGSHACPGRFFVANELKIALCHLLLKYDFRLVPGQERKPSIKFESAVMFDPRTEVQVRRRNEEIDLNVSSSCI